jgi:hypothetical protein
MAKIHSPACKKSITCSKSMEKIEKSQDSKLLEWKMVRLGSN